MKLTQLVMLTAVVAGGYSSCVWATKPCPLSPCLEAGEFVESKCEAAAQWIAIGHINDVVHDRQGHPLNKDFARFTLQIEKLEKGAQENTDKINFKVGWCSNAQELPEDASGSFRFYGAIYWVEGRKVLNHLYFEKFRSAF